MSSIALLEKKATQSEFWFLVFCSIFLISFWAALVFDQKLLFLVPFGFLFAFLCVSDPKKIFYLFFLILPFSTEVELPGGLGTDLPSEPIMLSLLVIFFGFLLSSKNSLRKSTILHPISALLILHLVWIAFSSIYATNQLYAFKYLLAKTWYIIPFYFLPFFFFKKDKDIAVLFKLFIIGLLLSVVYVMAQHAMNGFSFKTINTSVKPIFRNHVNYSAILALSMPYFWLTLKKSRYKLFWLSAIIFMLVAIYLSYTRAAYLVVLVCIAGYFMIRLRLTSIAVMLSVLISAGYLFYQINQSRYLELAPNYERTVAHDKFDNLVQATYKMEDISTMERLYRWVAGLQMIKERPVTGFGPSNFYINYQDHSVSSFQTYVSDNPEKSGIHNNYLMVLVEQGIPGLIIMLVIAFLPLLIGEQVYHQLQDSSSRLILMAAILSFLAIDVFIIINDLLEADKVGPFYFLNASIITFYALRKKVVTNL